MANRVCQTGGEELLLIEKGKLMVSAVAKLFELYFLFASNGKSLKRASWTMTPMKKVCVDVDSK